MFADVAEVDLPCRETYESEAGCRQIVRRTDGDLLFHGVGIVLVLIVFECRCIDHVGATFLQREIFPYLIRTEHRVVLLRRWMSKCLERMARASSYIFPVCAFVHSFETNDVCV